MYRDEWTLKPQTMFIWWVVFAVSVSFFWRDVHHLEVCLIPFCLWIFLGISLVTAWQSTRVVTSLGYWYRCHASCPSDSSESWKLGGKVPYQWDFLHCYIKFQKWTQMQEFRNFLPLNSGKSRFCRTSWGCRLTWRVAIDIFSPKHLATSLDSTWKGWHFTDIFI